MVVPEPSLIIGGQDRECGRLRDYLSLARPHSGIKHLFVLPGAALALILRPGASTLSLYTFIMVF